MCAFPSVVHARTNINISMKNYRFTLEKYRGIKSRYTCPQCGRKYVFTRYIDTETNQYISDDVGKCSRLDKCGYHYTPKQYFSDNAWKSECACVHNTRKCTNAHTPKPSFLPEQMVATSMAQSSAHIRWLARKFGVEQAEKIRKLYRVGGFNDRVIFWQIDFYGRVRTGKVMAYDPVTGCRKKEAGSVDWVHAMLRREGSLPDDWELVQSLYGEHLLPMFPTRTVAVVEAAKTAHVGSILLPNLVWVAVDSMTGLTAERLKPLAGRNVILFPDEGRGYEYWREKAPQIASEVGFSYRISSFMEGHEKGSDIADLV